jgi:Zn-dependent peptidase ImmA (M78 family)/DNA-binding XRE family transcriptional regulator
MIWGDRIRLVRELRGLTQKDLATEVGITRVMIAHIETGRAQPSDRLIEAISIRTGFPPAYFRQGPVPALPLGSLLFRARRAVPKWELAQAQRFGELVYECVQVLARRLSHSPPLRLPRFAHDPSKRVTPESAAQVTRGAIGLGPTEPIGHLVNTIEKAGVFVLALPTNLDKRDAFSTWVQTPEDLVPRPLIVVSSGVPGDRLRFSLAHEVGHLVLHQVMAGTIESIEREADLFATEFLLPRQAMVNEMTQPVTLTSLAELKPRWGVSIQALIMTAHEFGLITDRQKRYLFEQLGARGWRVREPIQMQAEKPRTLRRMAEVAFGEASTAARLAGAMSIPVGLARDILEVHAAKSEMPPIGRPTRDQQDKKVVRFTPRPRNLR